jgi:hypothetical protein
MRGWWIAALAGLMLAGCARVSNHEPTTDGDVPPVDHGAVEGDVTGDLAPPADAPRADTEGGDVATDAISPPPDLPVSSDLADLAADVPLLPDLAADVVVPPSDTGTDALVADALSTVEKVCTGGNGTELSFAAHTYILCHSALTWPEARDACASAGLHLVTITSQAENDWINATGATLAPGGMWWIGLNDLAQTGSWVWVEDDSPAVFTAWAAGEPSTAYSNEHCVDMPYSANNGWNNTRCDATLRYFCEM